MLGAPFPGNALSRTKHADADALAFLELLWGLHHELHRKSKRMLKDLGVTGPQRMVIRLVGRTPGLTAKDIAERAHHDPGTLSVILRSLERNGHIVRRTDASDRRRVRLELSDSGRRVDRTTKGTVEAAVRDALARLDPQEVEIVSRAIALLIEELDRTARDR